MDIRRIGQRSLPLLLAVSLIASAHARDRQGEEGRIQFIGAVVPETESRPLLGTGSASGDGIAETHLESLEAARTHAPPELLDYFAGYAGRNTRVVVTTYH